MKIQDFLVAAVQNIQILINHSKSKLESNVDALAGCLCTRSKVHRLCIWLISSLKTAWRNINSFSNSFPCLNLLKWSFNQSLSENWIWATARLNIKYSPVEPKNTKPHLSFTRNRAFALISQHPLWLGLMDYVRI